MSNQKELDDAVNTITGIISGLNSKPLPSAVSLKHCEDVKFQDCNFENCGLKADDVRNLQVISTGFSDTMRQQVIEKLYQLIDSLKDLDYKNTKQTMNWFERNAVGLDTILRGIELVHKFLGFSST